MDVVASPLPYRILHCKKSPDVSLILADIVLSIVSRSTSPWGGNLVLANSDVVRWLSRVTNHPRLLPVCGVGCSCIVRWQ